MRPRRSLRRMAVVGVGGFALLAACAVASLISIFLSTRNELERETRALLSEQQIADRIVATVYEQLFAAYRHLQSPTPETLEEYQRRGSEAYEDIRTYLFYDMPLKARLQVETIKELHEGLEVVTHQAFDLAESGNVDLAKARAEEFEVYAANLREAVARFISLREMERDALRAEQAIALRRYVSMAIVAVLVLVLAASWMARLLRRRLLEPLEQFSVAAARLGSGELDARLPAPRDLEFYAANSSFNAMADAIQTARCEVEKRNVELSEALSRLQETREELVQHEKLSAIGTMLAGLAHELNNPLAGILGTAECLEVELSESTDPSVRALAEELAQPLVKESLRARDLVRNLLQFSRRSTGELESVDLASTVGVAVGLRLHAFVQARKRLSSHVSPGIFVTAEPRRLQHAFINLINNALDAISESHGTTVTIRATDHDEQWTDLTVEDDGPGFREPRRVFDAFYTSKGEGTGTGLGLTLVQRFVTECGGTVAIENRPEGGARVTIRLRRSAAPSCVESLTPDAEDVLLERVPTRRRVLVVDDERALREFQRRMLARLDIDVLLASNGAEARDILRKEHVDAVIADVRMPGELDGVGLFKWVKREKSRLASFFMFVTGGVAEPGLQAVLESVPDRVLPKPFERDEYLDRIRNLLQGIESLNGAAA